MRFVYFLFLSAILLSCQNKPVYDEDAFNEMKRPNRLIEPYGSYLFSGTLDSFKTPKIIIDSNEVVLTYIDSLGKEQYITGSWEQKSLDTQVFNLPDPFKYGLFSYDLLYILDSGIMHYFEKVEN